MTLYAIDYGDGLIACDSLEAANNHALEINKRIKIDFPDDKDWNCTVEEWIGSAKSHAEMLAEINNDENNPPT